MRHPPAANVNATCAPASSRTRPAGDAADRTADDGDAPFGWLVTLKADGPTGGFFRDRKAVEW